MSKARLTEKYLQSLEAPGEGYTLVWDETTPGFGARIIPSGRISFLVFYRNEDGKQRRYSIGHFPAVSPSDARKKAIEIKGQVAGAKDPFDLIATRGTPKFAVLAHEYIERRCRQKKSGPEDERIINKDLLPTWRKIPAKSIKRRDVIELIDKINERGSPIMANRTLSLVSRIFNFGISRDLVEHNPTVMVRPPGKENQRDRVLKSGEIETFWTKIDTMSVAGPHVKTALRLILILGQRSGEILSMEWSDIDFETATWAIPGTKTKNGLPHQVPLSGLAVDLLSEIERTGPYVFPRKSGKGINPDYHMESSALAIAVRRNREHFGLDHFTPHDLRRTAASHMARLGVSRFIIRRILNHAEREVTDTYDRYSYLNEKREALNLWEIELRGLISGKISNIVSIPEKRNVV